MPDLSREVVLRAVMPILAEAFAGRAATVAHAAYHPGELRQAAADESASAAAEGAAHA